MKLTIAVAAAIMASTQLVEAAPVPHICLFGKIDCPPKPPPYTPPAKRYDSEQSAKSQLQQEKYLLSFYELQRPNQRLASLPGPPPKGDKESTKGAAEEFWKFAKDYYNNPALREYANKNGLLLKHSTEDGGAKDVKQR